LSGLLEIVHADVLAHFVSQGAPADCDNGSRYCDIGSRTCMCDDGIYRGPARCGGRPFVFPCSEVNGLACA
jgi:hypothetical protein